MDYSTLQNDIVTMLQSCPQLAQVFVFAIKDSDLESQINEGLTALGSGAAISVSKPFLVDINVEANPPTGQLKVMLITTVRPTINNGAAGTGLTCEEIDLIILTAMIGWGPEGSMAGAFYPAPNASTPIFYHKGSGKEGRGLEMRAMFSGDDYAQTNAPDFSGDAAAVTIAVPAPDAAAPVYYTTDGTCPGYNVTTAALIGSSALYAGAFAAESGTVLRAMAVAPGKTPSIVNYSTVP